MGQLPSFSNLPQWNQQPSIAYQPQYIAAQGLNIKIQPAPPQTLQLSSPPMNAAQHPGSQRMLDPMPPEMLMEQPDFFFNDHAAVDDGQQYDLLNDYFNESHQSAGEHHNFDLQNNPE